MRSHWKEMGFSPTSLVLDSDEINDSDDIIFNAPINNTDNFPPKQNKPKNVVTSSHNGVIVRNLPLDMPESDIESFLVSKGMPNHHPAFKVTAGRKNKNVEIEDLDMKICETLIENIYEKIFFNKTIYCRWLKI